MMTSAEHEWETISFRQLSADGDPLITPERIARDLKETFSACPSWVRALHVDCEGQAIVIGVGKLEAMSKKEGSIFDPLQAAILFELTRFSHSVVLDSTGDKTYLKFAPSHSQKDNIIVQRIWHDAGEGIAVYQPEQRNDNRPGQEHRARRGKADKAARASVIHAAREAAELAGVSPSELGAYIANLDNLFRAYDDSANAQPVQP